jgi:hypothetical protein
MHCNECNINHEVIGFERDDPILACGHIKRVTLQLNQNSMIDFCPICVKMVTVFTDKKGLRRCGGNLIDNPGCGCDINKIKWAGLDQRLRSPA